MITSTIDFENYDQVEENLLNIVRPEWVEHAQVKRKLPNPKQYSPDPRMFFSGLIVTVAEDIPDGDKDAIIGGVLAMGGLYSSAISRMVTHVVALTTDPPKCKVAIQKELECKIVLPHWFDDCLKLQRKIDEGPYTLPDPDLTDGNTPKPMSKISRPDLVTSMYTRPSHLPEVDGTDSQKASKLDVFKDRKIMLSQDIEISKHLRATIEDMVLIGGGEIVDDLADAEILVCQYRQGLLYRKASTEGKTVGNLQWLYHVITHNRWTSPMRRLLHYPFSRTGLTGFEKYRLSLSNYSGEARVYLENLAKAAGCEFTKTFKPDNTHLITAHKLSEKCDAAQDWGIDIVNHLWLEDSYAKWHIQPLTIPRYTKFPERTNLSEVVGQTPIDRSTLEKLFYPKPTAHPVAMEDLEDEEEEDLEQAENDVYMTADQDSVASEHAEADHAVMQDKGHNAVNGHSSPEPKTPAFASRRPGRPPKSAQQPKTPIARVLAPGKENETPITTGGRTAKNRAAAKLHDMADDIDLYQKELKRVGGVTHGGKRPDHEVVQGYSASRKRSASAEDGPVSDDEYDEPQKKKTKAPPPMKLLVTGWDGASNSKAKLRDIGIILTDDHSKCTHLAASKILRTKKFMCALAYAPKVLSISFVEDCLAEKKLLDPNDYPLVDKAGEKNYGVSLQKSLERARARKRKLLNGMTIYVTKDIHGGYETYEAIIKANGGNPLMYQARPGSIQSRRPGSKDGSDDEEGVDDDVLYLIRGDTPTESKLAGRFVKTAAGVHWRPRVVSSSWLLDSALAQELKWKEEYEYGQD